MTKVWKNIFKLPPPSLRQNNRYETYYFFFPTRIVFPRAIYYYLISTNRYHNVAHIVNKITEQRPVRWNVGAFFLFFLINQIVSERKIERARFAMPFHLSSECKEAATAAAITIYYIALGGRRYRRPYYHNNDIIVCSRIRAAYVYATAAVKNTRSRNLRFIII